MFVPFDFFLSFKDAINYIFSTKEYSDSTESETEREMKEIPEAMVFVCDAGTQVCPMTAKPKRLASSAKSVILSVV